MQVVENAKRNILFGFVNRVILLIIPFIERTVIQRILGSQYLGLDSLFVSVLQVLNLAELGFSSAMVYNMYKPAAEGNVQKMNALLNYYKKVYKIIGIAIIGLGLLLIPFIPFLINGSHPNDVNLTALYLVYLVNTALSYFLFAYQNAIVVVHQREDIRSLVNSVVKIGLTLSQIILISATRNYFLFVFILPLFTIINNLWLAWRVKSIFPQYKAEGQITSEDRNNVRKLVAGTFIQQACSVTRNSFDSICISAFLGLSLTAIYNNYYLILNGVTTFVAIFTSSFIGGVGNHVATRTVQENFEEMKKLDFIYLWIGGWCSICLFCLYQPFMKLWMGDEMMLPFSAVILFCVYFYILKLGDVKSMYNSANGLWWKHRYRAICETLLNLILNISFGYIWGVHGIILATIISLFLCNYIWATRIIFKFYFITIRIGEYYLYQGKQSLIVAISALVTYIVCSSLSISSTIMELLVRGFICIILPNVLFIVIFRNNEAFKFAKRIILKR